MRAMPVLTTPIQNAVVASDFSMLSPFLAGEIHRFLGERRIVSQFGKPWVPQAAHILIDLKSGCPRSRFRDLGSISPSRRAPLQNDSISTVPIAPLAQCRKLDHARKIPTSQKRDVGHPPAISHIDGILAGNGSFSSSSLRFPLDRLSPSDIGYPTNQVAPGWHFPHSSCRPAKISFRSAEPFWVGSSQQMTWRSIWQKGARFCETRVSAPAC